MTQHKFEKEKAFITRIEQLDTAALASLRRGCGERDPTEGRCPWFYSVIHGVASDAVAFLVASLLAQYRTSDIKTGRHHLEGDFGITWKRAQDHSGSASLAKRFEILLDADYDPRTGSGDLPYRLRQLVRLAKSKGVGLDWAQLLVDLRAWHHPSKLTQKKWARHYFTVEPSEPQNNNSETEE